MGNIVVSALQLLAGQLDVVAQVIGGLFVLLLCGAFWWNRRQRAAKEPGMASWQFISLCFLIALTAVACGAYGLGLKFTAKESDGAPQTPASTPRAAKPRTQPYRLSENAQTIVFRDSAFIPLDPRNSEFQRYQAWLSAGNRPDPAEATLPPVYAARGPSDADKEVQIIYELLDLLQKEVFQRAYEGQSLMKAWQLAFLPDRRDDYLKQLADFSEGFRKASGKLLDRARQAKQFCENDLCVIVGFAGEHSKVTDAIDKLREGLSDLSKVIDGTKYQQVNHNVPQILLLFIEKPKQALIAYAISMEYAERELRDRAAQLSEIASRK